MSTYPWEWAKSLDKMPDVLVANPEDTKPRPRMAAINWNGDIYFAYQGSNTVNLVTRCSTAYSAANPDFFDQSHVSNLSVDLLYDGLVNYHSFVAFDSSSLFLMQMSVLASDFNYYGIYFREITFGENGEPQLSNPHINMAELSLSGTMKDATLVAAGQQAFLVIATDTALSIAVFDGKRVGPTSSFSVDFTKIYSIDATSILAPASGHAGPQVLVSVLGQPAGSAAPLQFFSLDLTAGGAPQLTPSSLHPFPSFAPKGSTVPPGTIRLTWGSLVPPDGEQPTAPGFSLVSFVPVREESGLLPFYGSDIYVASGTFDDKGSPATLGDFTLQAAGTDFSASSIGGCNVMIQNSEDTSIVQSFYQIAGVTYEVLDDPGYPEPIIIKESSFSFMTFQLYRLKNLGKTTSQTYPSENMTQDQLAAAMSTWILQSVIVGVPPYPANLNPDVQSASVGFSTSHASGKTLNYETTSGMSVSAGIDAGIFSVDATFQNSVDTGKTVSFDVTYMADEPFNAAQVGENTVGWYVFFAPVYGRVDYQYYTFDGSSALSYSTSPPLAPIILSSIFIDEATGTQKVGTQIFDFYINDPSTMPDSPNVTAGPASLYTFTGNAPVIWPASTNCENSQPGPNWYDILDLSDADLLSTYNLVPSTIQNPNSGEIGQATVTESVGPVTKSAQFDYSTINTKSTTNTIQVDSSSGFGIFKVSAETTYTVTHSTSNSTDTNWTWSMAYGPLGTRTSGEPNSFTTITVGAYGYGFGDTEPTLWILPAPLTQQKPWFIGYQILDAETVKTPDDTP